MKKTTPTFLLIFLLSINIYSSDLYKAEAKSIPEIQKVAEIYLGDQMLSQEIGQLRECITPKQTFSKTRFGGYGYYYYANRPMCRVSAKEEAYMPTYNNFLTTTGELIYPVLWKNKGSKSSLCSQIGPGPFGNKDGCVKKISAEDIVESKLFIRQDNTMQKAIEYSGKDGDMLKFTYVETCRNCSDQTVVREFKINLSEESIGSYKGSVFEVLEATSSKLKYKVIRHFP